MAIQNQEVNRALRRGFGRGEQPPRAKPEPSGELPETVEEIRAIGDPLEAETVAAGLADQAAGLAEQFQSAAPLAGAAQARLAELEEGEGQGGQERGA